MRRWGLLAKQVVTTSNSDMNDRDPGTFHTQCMSSSGYTCLDQNDLQLTETWSELMCPALKVVLLTCSVSTYDHNWSIEDWIHSKRRNRLGRELVECLVCTHINLRGHLTWPVSSVWRSMSLVCSVGHWDDGWRVFVSRRGRGPSLCLWLRVWIRKWLWLIWYGGYPFFLFFNFFFSSLSPKHVVARNTRTYTEIVHVLH